MPSWRLPEIRASGLVNSFRKNALRLIYAQRRCWPATCRAESTQAAGSVPLRKQLKEEAKAQRSAALTGTSALRCAVPQNLASWELTVGIEIHAQLNTARKLFSYAAASINDAPNSHVALFDIATPGSLPRIQTAALIPAIRAAIALGCTIQRTSRFDRKHYFYHDQPAGYQLTQYYEPFAKNGNVRLTAEDGIGVGDGDEITVGITQVQMEQDTAKSQDSDTDNTLIDYNRAGQPLIEIISLPDIHSPETAAAYVRKIQSILVSVNAVTTGMEMGGLRADVNVSLRHRAGPIGNERYRSITGLGQRTEIKNLSTFKGVEMAIRAERNRQIGILESGGTIDGDTRTWSLAAPSITRKLRGKEGDVDYRYMPDPDISPIIIGADLIACLQQTLPMLPNQLLSMLVKDEKYGLSPTDAKILQQLDEGDRLEYYLSVVEIATKIYSGCKIQIEPRSLGQLAANWVMHELGSLLTTSDRTWKDMTVPPGKLAAVLVNLASSKIIGRSAKQIVKLLFHGDEREVNVIIREHGLEYKPLSDDEYVTLASGVVQNHSDMVQQIRDGGKVGKLMFLVGQMLREGQEGRVEATRAESVLRHMIGL